MAEFTRGIPYSTFSARVRPAVHYSGKADLRGLGIDAHLHLDCKAGGGSHKLEIFDAGKKTYSEVTELIASLTDANPERWGVMRIDLTADVPDIPVEWAKQNVRFKFKRTEREYGEIKYGLLGRGKIETITAGSRPNLFRIYDKVSESRMQFHKLQRKQSRDSDPLDFEQEFGFKETDTVTRFERQCGGKGIPSELETFGDLQRAPDFNPFQNLQIVRSGAARLPTPEDCEGLEYYTGMGLRGELKERGMQGFRKALNSQTNGNAARTMQRYARFLVDEKPCAFSIEQLREIYRESVIRQLSA